MTVSTPAPGLTQTEPAVLIGLLATIIVGALQQVVGSGLITSAGQLDGLNILITVIPIIAAFLIRNVVTSPATAAKLAAGA